ncbi:hypothetical protein [Methanothrix sp.]|uniref:hypothetical protein n=1 Tax=Methanothrix sp. TaxID=90426 RepID=UPI003C756CC5
MRGEGESCTFRTRQFTEFIYASLMEVLLDALHLFMYAQKYAVRGFHGDLAQIASARQQSHILDSGDLGGFD